MTKAGQIWAGNCRHAHGPQRREKPGNDHPRAISEARRTDVIPRRGIRPLSPDDRLQPPGQGIWCDATLDSVFYGSDGMPVHRPARWHAGKAAD